MKKKEENVAVKKTKKPMKKKAVKKTVAKKKAPQKTAKKSVKKSIKKAPPKKAAKSKPAVKARVKKAALQKKIASPKASPSTKAPQAVKLPEHFQNFVTPLDDRLLIRLNEAAKMTAGGLYIPDTVSDVSGNLQGHVVAVGRGHRNEKGHLRPMDVKIGDKVIFPGFAGSKIKIQNEELVILREAELMGVISK